VAGVYPRIMKDGDMNAGAWSCGMVAGLIRDVPTVKELIDRIMKEAEQIITRLIGWQSAMRLGIYLNSQHPTSDDPARCLAETLEQVRLIRSLDFDSIWAGEHHVTPGFHFFPQFALLQRAASEAEGLWIGTNVALLPSGYENRAPKQSQGDLSASTQ
jgi:hypothetical protein